MELSEIISGNNIIVCWIFTYIERFQYSLANIHIMLYRKMKKVCYRWFSFPGQWSLLTMLLKDNLMNVLIYKTQVPRNMEQLLCIDQPPLFKCIYETFYIGKINWRKQTGVTLQLIMETFWVVGLYLKIIRTELGFLFLAKDFFVLLYCHTTLITFSDVLTIFLTQKRTESVYHPLMHNKAFPILR